MFHVLSLQSHPVLLQQINHLDARSHHIGAEVYTLSIPTKKNEEFVAKFYKEKEYYPTWLRGKAYLSAMFWAEAVKKAGTTDVAAVIKAWEGLSYDGPAGVWTMRACDHQAQVPLWYTEIVKTTKYFNHISTMRFRSTCWHDYRKVGRSTL